MSEPLNLCQFSVCYCKNNPSSFIDLHLMIGSQQWAIASQQLYINKQIDGEVI